MEESKKWYESKSVIGGVVAILSSIGAVLGFDIDQSLQGDIANYVLSVSGVFGGALAIYGRIKASKKIG